MPLARVGRRLLRNLCRDPTLVKLAPKSGDSVNQHFLSTTLRTDNQIWRLPYPDCRTDEPKIRKLVQMVPAGVQVL